MISRSGVSASLRQLTRSITSSTLPSLLPHLHLQHLTKPFSKARSASAVKPSDSHHLFQEPPALLSGVSAIHTGATSLAAEAAAALPEESANHAEIQQEPSQDDNAAGEQLSRDSHTQQSQAAAAQTRARKLVPAKGSKRSKQTTPAGIDPPLIVEDKLIHKQLPRYAWTLMTRLKLEGHDCYVVGGAVRDMLSNRAPQDVDILTSATHSRVKKLFRGAIEVGRNFPIMLVPVDGKRVEVSAFKKASFKEQLPADADMMAKIMYRKRIDPPVEVQIGGASWATYRRTDALRRDFTVNGLMCDPFSQLVFDYTGGLADCSKRLVRTIGPAETSLRHDPIRMLRAVRFCSTSGWKMAADLKAVIANHPGLLAEAQRGRLHLELRKMLLRGAAQRNIMLLWRLKLLDLLLPTYACWLQVAHISRRAGAPLPPCFSLLQALDEAVPQGLEAPAEVVLALLAAPVLAQVMLANRAKIAQVLQQGNAQRIDSSTATQPAEQAGASTRKRSSKKAAQAGPGKPGGFEEASKPSEGKDVPLADILATGLRLFRELDPQSTAVKLGRGARRDAQHQSGKPAGVPGPLTAEQRMYAALVSATVQALLVPSREALQAAAAQLGTQGQPQALNPAEPPFPRLEMENAIEIMCREFSRRHGPPDQVPRVKARHNMAEKVQLFSSIVGGPEWHQQTQLASQDDDQDKAAPD